MEVNEMEMFIDRTRTDFRSLIENDILNDELILFFKKKLNKCCSQFEEDTLIENLAEEYKEYLKELAA